MGSELFSLDDRLKDRDRLQTGVVINDLTQTIDRPVDDRGDWQVADRALRTRKALWSQACDHIGTRYADASLSNYECLHDGQAAAIKIVRNYLITLEPVDDDDREPVDDDDREGGDGSKNLVLIGPTGTGKDHIITFVVRFCVMRFGMVPYWFDGQALFAAVRDTYADGETETPIIIAAKRADLVAMSDPFPAEGRLSDHQRNILHRLIDTCYRKPRPMIATLNVATRDELDAKLGATLASRLCHNAVVVPCDWPDYRRGRKVRLIRDERGIA